MPRFVKLTVVYDMDDTEKSLADELRDWFDENISVGDFERHEVRIRLEPLTDLEAAEFLNS